MYELIALLIIIYIYIKIFKLFIIIIRKAINLIINIINNLDNSYKKNNYNYKRKNIVKLSSKEKGRIGEDKVIYYLELDLTYYKKILKNLYIPLENNSTTEIDIIMICNYGIYVFEVKHYKGFIYGNRKYNTWYQTVQNGTPFEFSNPINQNYYHIEKLKAFLKIDKEELYKSIVFFSGKAEFKSYIENMKSDYILTDKDYDILNPLIKESNTELLTDFEVDEIYNKLLCCTYVDIATKLNHINKIKYNKFKKNNKEFY